MLLLQMETTNLTTRGRSDTLVTAAYSEGLVHLVVCAIKMTGTFRNLLLLVLFIFADLANANCVVLIHGLARSASSMSSMEDTLLAAGYRVANVDYPSRRQPIEKLSAPAIERGLAECRLATGEQVHFVTHSMGGILLRYYLSHSERDNSTIDLDSTLGNVVMLGPPNQGSEAVDALKNMPGFSWLNGPAGGQLGTDDNSLPLDLPAVDFSLGVIAGNRSIDPISSYYLPNPDDGKVSVARTRVDGMRAHILLPVTHAFMMRNDVVQQQTVYFLKNGIFDNSLAKASN